MINLTNTNTNQTFSILGNTNPTAGLNQPNWQTELDKRPITVLIKDYFWKNELTDELKIQANELLTQLKSYFNYNTNFILQIQSDDLINYTVNANFYINGFNVSINAFIPKYSIDGSVDNSSVINLIIANADIQNYTSLTISHTEVKPKKTIVIDDLESESSTNALSAKQGYTLNQIKADRSNVDQIIVADEIAVNSLASQGDVLMVNTDEFVLNGTTQTEGCPTPILNTSFANKEYVDTQDATKADTAYVESELNAKADLSNTNQNITANQITVNSLGMVDNIDINTHNINFKGADASIYTDYSIGDSTHSANIQMGEDLDDGGYYGVIVKNIKDRTAGNSFSINEGIFIGDDYGNDREGVVEIRSRNTEGDNGHNQSQVIITPTTFEVKTCVNDIDETNISIDADGEVKIKESMTGRGLGLTINDEGITTNGQLNMQDGNIYIGSLDLTIYGDGGNSIILSNINMTEGCPTPQSSDGIANKGYVDTQDALKADITPTNGATSALRPLFVAAGATYNSTTGYYELNGLTDITEGEMMRIYNVSNDWSPTYSKYRFVDVKERALLPCKTGMYSYSVDLTSTFAACDIINCEFTQMNSQYGYIQPSSFAYCWTRCRFLKSVREILNFTQINTANSVNEIFGSCDKLESFYGKNLHINISIPQSPLLSLSAVMSLLNESNATSAITITLHPTVYAAYIVAKDNDVAIDYDTWILSTSDPHYIDSPSNLNKRVTVTGTTFNNALTAHPLVTLASA